MKKNYLLNIDQEHISFVGVVAKNVRSYTIAMLVVASIQRIDRWKRIPFSLELLTNINAKIEKKKPNMTLKYT